MFSLLCSSQCSSTTTDGSCTCVGLLSWLGTKFEPDLGSPLMGDTALLLLQQHCCHSISLVCQTVAPIGGDCIGSAADLLDSHGLAGKRRLLSAQRGGLHAQQPQVRGHAVAGVQLHDIARHELPGRQVRHLRSVLCPGHPAALTVFRSHPQC